MVIEADMNVIFWQNMPSHHQSGAIRRLTEIWDGEVHGVFDMEMLPRRKALGWKTPDMGNMQMHYLNDQEFSLSFVKEFCEKNSNAIHILGGFRGCRSVTLAWSILKKNPTAKLVCMAERPHFRGWKSVFQWIWYRAFFKRYGSRFKAVLSMGTLGVDCFRRLGCSKKILYPYIYQVDEDSPSIVNSFDGLTERVHFVYIGKFNQRKGVDVLLETLSQLSAGWRLDFIGSGGTLEPSVRESTHSSKCVGDIRYLGKIDSDEVIQHLREYDVCLIPSQHDGWGMVTNEALQAGIGVIVSDAAGSMDLVRASGAGLVVKAGDAFSLAMAMQEVIDHPEKINLWKERAEAFQPKMSAEVVGDYLADVLTHCFIRRASSPVVPWER